MNTTGNVSAAVSACFAAASWLATVEMSLRIVGTVVAIAAGLLAIIVHVRTLNKKDKK